MNKPIQDLSKQELIKMARGHCKHRHSYLQHPKCYWTELGVEPKIGCLDIETTWGNFKADAGYLLTYAIKTVEKEEVVSGTVNYKDVQDKEGHEDRRLVAELIEHLYNYDKILTFYGSRFDAPYIRTRALINGLDFPGYGTFIHKDVYDIIRTKFSLRPKSQDHSCRYLVGESHKTHPGNVCWRNAAKGDKKALQIILEHNISDVMDLEALWLKVRDFSRKSDTSI